MRVVIVILLAIICCLLAALVFIQYQATAIRIYPAGGDNEYVNAYMIKNGTVYQMGQSQAFLVEMHTCTMGEWLRGPSETREEKRPSGGLGSDLAWEYYEEMMRADPNAG